MASSLTMGIGMSVSVMKETKAVTSASTPGTRRPRKLARAASSHPMPAAMPRTM